MSLGAALHNSDMGTQQRVDGFSYARNLLERLSDFVSTIHIAARDTKLSTSITPTLFMVASAFTAKI